MYNAFIVAKDHSINYVNLCTPNTMRQMSDQLPTTKAQLTQIDGFPEHKYDKFQGIRFLNITLEYHNKILGE